MSLEEIKSFRENKLNKFEEKEDAYPASVLCDFSLAEVVENFSKLSRRRKNIFLVGRVFSIRIHGGMIFCDFKDGSINEKEKKTASLQAYLKKDILGDDKFSFFEDTVDMGDFVEFEGTLFKTKRGERSIKVVSWRIISKGLRPLPEKWHGLSDVEERFRKRYLDLLMSDDVRFRFELRSKIITEIRNFLNKNDFLEVETPILQSLAGGALAEPFKTHHNALDSDLFLRIAPELYLKRLLMGGFEKVYEIGKNFRNEGIDVSHNPEFTMLEFYQAYKDADFARSFVEELLGSVVKKVFGKKNISYEGTQISFSKKFKVMTFFDVLERHALLNNPSTATREDFTLKAQQFGIEVREADSIGKIADNIFKKVCRSKIIQPTFIIDHPLSISPLAKRKEKGAEVVDRFQLVAGGLELVNGFSELNDPREQSKRFEKQQELKKMGDKEAPEFDNSFIEAMEYGMPPAVGVGIGIDRLIMFLLNIPNIREVVLFPTLKSKK
ncbi:MAG: lysine--tRNA ligase [Candidatus Marinimicrobia bacterium]|nr:lysine--tRNA ligase [Candidatus Neomarinimicrobiota bacterium]